MTTPCPLPDLPQNAELLVFLRGQAAPPRLADGFDDYGGFEPHSHPDLISRLEQLAPQWPILPVYGVSVLAYEGVAAVVALSMEHLLFRLPAAPSDLEQATPIPPLTDTGWHAVSAWQSDLPSAEGVQRLSALTRAALDRARDLATQ